MERPERECEGPGIQTLTLQAQEQLVWAELRRLSESFPTGRAVSWRWRPYRTTAGMAYFTLWEIGLNQPLLNTEERLLSTLRHEYAHLLAVARAGRKARGHGPDWRKAMQDLGEPIEVKHTFDCPRNQRRQRVWYRCSGCGVEFARHRALPKRKKFTHNGCGGAIQFVRREPIK